MSLPSPRVRLPLTLALLLSAACGGDDDDAPATDGGSQIDGDVDDADAAVSECEPQSGTTLALELVTTDVEEPVFVTSPPGDPRLFIVEKHGVIRIFKNGVLLAEPFLDIDDRVHSSPAGNEQGLLGLAFHPDYADNGRFFVYYVAVDDPDAGEEANRVSEFQVSDSDPDVADPNSEEKVLAVADVFSNHNGGMIAFGDDGYLYIGMGDGGDGGDPDDNGQDFDTLLGDMLRIDIDGAAPYAIPGSNPFVGVDGADEIFISGVRNPWRWSFDRQTGDMYIADVGQGTTEEVNVLEPLDQAGANLGWDQVEGAACYNSENPGCTVGDYTGPVLTYPHNGSDRSITGGYVYRGTCFPDLQGTYFYGDWVTDQIWTFEYDDGAATNQQEVTDDIDPDNLINGLSSFGQDAYGELYVISLRPDSFGVPDGAIYHIVAE